ncbi:MAG: hypothetical protein LBK53_00990 [Heliobacteriaceae bacterium]|jgi:hypothetical protein|nr:hypothetical protein [Heliobacteriaceae bacterium]
MKIQPITQFNILRNKSSITNTCKHQYAADLVCFQADTDEKDLEKFKTEISDEKSPFKSMWGLINKDNLNIAKWLMLEDNEQFTKTDYYKSQSIRRVLECVDEYNEDFFNAIILDKKLSKEQKMKAIENTPEYQKIFWKDMAENQAEWDFLVDSP